MFQDNCYDRDLDINTNFNASNMTNNIDVDIDVQGVNSDMNMTSCNQQPIVEPMRERCVNRTIVHEVRHVCPIRTRIINHHVYKHTYRPEYSCCEENVVSNVQSGSCCDY